MVSPSGHSFKNFLFNTSNNNKKSWCLSSSWLDLLSAVGDAGKHGADNELCLHNGCLFPQRSSERFLSHWEEVWNLALCRNGRPLTRHDMTRLGPDWRTKQYVHGHVTKTTSHLFPAPSTHLWAEMPGAILSASRFTAWKNGPPFSLKQAHKKHQPLFYEEISLGTSEQRELFFWLHSTLWHLSFQSCHLAPDLKMWERLPLHIPFLSKPTFQS